MEDAGYKEDVGGCLGSVPGRRIVITVTVTVRCRYRYGSGSGG